MCANATPWGRGKRYVFLYNKIHESCVGFHIYFTYFFTYIFITEHKVMYQKLVGVTIDEELTFKEHVDQLCKNRAQKLAFSIRCITTYQWKRIVLQCRNHGDGSENVKKAIGWISKTTTLHVHHAFLYISLPSPHKYGVIIPNFTFCGERKQATTNFSFSSKTWVWSPRNQLQGNSPTFDIFRELE